MTLHPVMVDTMDILLMPLLYLLLFRLRVLLLSSGGVPAQTQTNDMT